MTDLCYYVDVFQVLSEVDHNGMNITEVAKRIQERGYRDLRTSKTPEASVAGALSRDVVFCRVKPSTYALQAIVAHHNRLVAAERNTPVPDAEAAAGGGGGSDGTQQQPKQEGRVEGAEGAAAGGGGEGGVKDEGSVTPHHQQQQKQYKEDQGSEVPRSSSSTADDEQKRAEGSRQQQETAATVAAAAAAAAGGGGGGGGGANAMVRAKSGVEVVERNSPAVNGGGHGQHHDDEDVSDSDGDSRCVGGVSGGGVGEGSDFCESELPVVPHVFHHSRQTVKRQLLLWCLSVCPCPVCCLRLPQGMKGELC
jgi:hypothetical protein